MKCHRLKIIIIIIQTLILLWCLSETNYILATSICKFYIVECVANITFSIRISVIPFWDFCLLRCKCFNPPFPQINFLQCSNFYTVSEFYCITSCSNFPHTKYIVLLASPKPSEAENQTHYRMRLNKVRMLIYWHACGLTCQTKKNNFDRKWTVPAFSFHNYYHFRTFLVFS